MAGAKGRPRAGHMADVTAPWLAECSVASMVATRDVHWDDSQVGEMDGKKGLHSAVYWAGPKVGEMVGEMVSHRAVYWAGWKVAEMVAGTVESAVASLDLMTAAS